MSHQSDLIATDIDAYLAQHEQKELLRFLTCGSVDDGKSTLIGRLFFDAKLMYEDTLKTLEQDSVVHGTTGGGFDPALFTDGLKAEREQGITIDVAYRYFSTAKRKFIIADTPGHEQYTRNMATGASTVDLAVILIDARHGVVTQTKRHSFIVSLLGIKHVLVAVNKMDLVEFCEQTFDRICDDYRDFSNRLDIPDLHFIPISALLGDNIVDPSKNMSWYRGSTLMNFLNTVNIGSDRNLVDFRFPVQYVNRPHLDFRGFCGTIASGVVRRGDELMALPSRKVSRVKSIVTFDGELDEAFAPQAVTLTLEDEIDVSRGDMLVRIGNVPLIDDQFDAMVVWMSDEPLVPGKQYLFKQTSKIVSGTISTMRYRVDVNSLHSQQAPTLSLNEIGRCHLSLSDSVSFDAYRRNQSSGAVIIVDRISNVTVGVAMILDQMQGDAKDHWDDEPVRIGLQDRESQVTSDERTARFGQTAATILIYGLTSSGKRPLAGALERRLFDEGRAVTVLDGQNMRLGISKDLGFSADERSENLRRAMEVAKLMNNAGLIAIGSFVAPDANVRDKARDVIGSDRFIEVFLDVPIDVCREHDTSGMYEKADSGEIKNFPGVTATYDVPESANLVLRPHESSIESCVDVIIDLLRQREIL
ncbi:MAG: sulfate adenylyltransferase subunit CysN [Planctomycetota bacterium]|nr:sulfate adenylyltransferase subunit CysN [Planctomycetota bacterium]